MNVARIVDGIVVNLEVATPEWALAHDGKNGTLFRALPANAIILLGDVYDEESNVYIIPESRLLPLHSDPAGTEEFEAALAAYKEGIDQ
jgi:hypothetical protein